MTESDKYAPTFGLLVPGAGRLTNADAEQEFIRSVNGDGETGRPSSIEVSRPGTKLRVSCSRCKEKMFPDSWFCCDWARQMYTKYFGDPDDQH